MHITILMKKFQQKIFTITTFQKTSVNEIRLFISILEVRNLRKSRS